MADTEVPIKVEPGDASTAEAKKPEDDAKANVTGTGEEVPPESAPEGEAEPPKPRMDFIFDDEVKKKKKKKKKPPPVKRPTRAQYELTIVNLNNILSQLNEKVFRLDDFNVKKSEEVVEINDHHKEVTEHLKRVHKKHIKNLAIEEEYNVEIIKKRDELELESQKRIKELQTQYRMTQSQLLGEIDMLSTKLRTLRVFSDERDEMLHQLSNMETMYKQSDQAHQDRLYAMQQKAVVERNKLDKDAKARYERIIDDFTLSREVRNAAYTRCLLSENSELRRKYNKLIPINLRKERELKVLLEKTANGKDNYTAINDMTKQLETAQVNREQMLEKLKKIYEFYKLQVVVGSKYRRLYEAIKLHEEKESKKLKSTEVLDEDIRLKNDILLEKLMQVKEAEHEYLYVRQQYDQFVDGAKGAIYALCNLPKYGHLFPQTFIKYDAKRSGIIRCLIDLITNCERDLKSKKLLKAQYYKGYLGFMPYDYLMCRVFDCKGCKEQENLCYVPSFCRISQCTDPEKEEVVEDEKDVVSDPGLLCLK